MHPSIMLLLMLVGNTYLCGICIPLIVLVLVLLLVSSLLVIRYTTTRYRIADVVDALSVLS